MARATPPTKVTKGQQTRRAILDSAIERFGRDGFRATSVAEICRAADVGGSLAYAYFDDKEALFYAALDDDVAGLINEGVSTLLETGGDDGWGATLIRTLVEALERHPLARRVVAGLEPAVTGRVIELSALADLRAAVADRLRTDQEHGRVRADIDPVVIGGGAVTIFISLLMSAVQFGLEAADLHGPGVMAVLASAIEAVPAEVRESPGS